MLSRLFQILSKAFYFLCVLRLSISLVGDQWPNQVLPEKSTYCTAIHTATFWWDTFAQKDFMNLLGTQKMCMQATSTSHGSSWTTCLFHYNEFMYKRSSRHFTYPKSIQRQRRWIVSMSMTSWSAMETYPTKRNLLMMRPQTKACLLTAKATQRDSYESDQG